MIVNTLNDAQNFTIIMYNSFPIGLLVFSCTFVPSSSLPWILLYCQFVFLQWMTTSFLLQYLLFPVASGLLHKFHGRGDKECASLIDGHAHLIILIWDSHKVQWGSMSSYYKESIAWTSQTSLKAVCQNQNAKPYVTGLSRVYSMFTWGNPVVNSHTDLLHGR